MAALSNRIAAIPFKTNFLLAAWVKLWTAFKLCMAAKTINHLARRKVSSKGVEGIARYPTTKTLLTAVNVMLFSLIHNPCSTTIYTIYKETGSKRWTIVASLLPVALGFIVTFFVAQIWRLLAGAG